MAVVKKMPEISQDQFEAKLPHIPPATVEELRQRANSGGASALEASRKRLNSLRGANGKEEGKATADAGGSSVGSRGPRKSSVTFLEDAKQTQKQLHHYDSFVHGYKREISHRSVLGNRWKSIFYR